MHKKSKDRQNVTRNTTWNHLPQEVNVTSRCVKPCNVDCWSLVPTICLCILDSWSLEEPTHHTPTPCHTWDCLKVNVDNICCKLQLKHFNYWNKFVLITGSSLHCGWMWIVESNSIRLSNPKDWQSIWRPVRLPKNSRKVDNRKWKSRQQPAHRNFSL